MLAVQQEGDAPDAHLAQLGEVVAHPLGGVLDLEAGGIGHARLVLERARNGAGRQTGRLRDVSDRDLAHGRVNIY